MSLNQKSLPDDLKDADLFALELQNVYGEALAIRIVEQLGKVSRHCFWANPLKPSGEDGEEDTHHSIYLGSSDQDTRYSAMPVQHMPEMFSVSRDSGLTTSEAAIDAGIYIQNPSSYLAVKALAPQPDEEVLDLAAAPGGKTIAIAAAMRNTGRVAAVEPVKGRFHRLRANTARCGVTNVVFYQRDGRGVGRAVPERFDRVLLDAPCSSEARMRWFDNETYRHWSRQKVKETQRKQKSLLRSAYAALRPGGRIIYCTCSFSVAENELVVQHLLKRTDAKLEHIDTQLPEHITGVTHWQNKGLAPEMARTIRVIPNDVWDGFYLARLTKPVAN